MDGDAPKISHTGKQKTFLSEERKGRLRRKKDSNNLEKIPEIG